MEDNKEEWTVENLVSLLKLTFQTTEVSRPLSRKMAPAMDSTMSPRTFGALQSLRPKELNPGFNNSS